MLANQVRADVQARKKVAAMKVEGARLRQRLEEGGTIRPLDAFTQEDVGKITTLQANFRGHLARKRAAHRADATGDTPSVRGFVCSSWVVESAGAVPRR